MTKPVFSGELRGDGPLPRRAGANGHSLRRQAVVATSLGVQRSLPGDTHGKETGEQEGGEAAGIERGDGHNVEGRGVPEEAGR